MTAWWRTTRRSRFEIARRSGDDGNFTIHATKHTAVGTIANDDVVSGVGLSVVPESVSEGGGATTVTATAGLQGGGVLDAGTFVKVSVEGGSAEELVDFAQVQDFTVTIPARQTSATGQFTLTPVDDDIDEPDETVAITGVLVDDTGTTLEGEDVVPVTDTSVTIEDDDARGVRVTPTSLTVREGESGTYTVVLLSVPASDVMVSASVPEADDGTLYRVSPPSLVFTGESWNEAQTVTVQTIDDRVQGSDRTAVVGHGVSGGDYEGQSADAVTVTVVDTTMPALSAARRSRPGGRRIPRVRRRARHCEHAERDGGLLDDRRHRDEGRGLRADRGHAHL